MRRLRQPLQNTVKNSGPAVGQALAHESAHLHVSGQARYVDDLPEPRDLLHVAMGTSTVAHGRIVELDLSAVRQSPGVVAVFVADDVPGSLDISPIFSGDVLLAKDSVQYVGQPLFFVAAETFEAAQRAASLAAVEYDILEAILDIKQALKKEALVLPPHTMSKGDVAAALPAAPCRLSREYYIKGQEHFYLEGQVAMAVPEEDGMLRVHSSSQHPSEIQKCVAEVLHLPSHKVIADVRRMGGAFGGKESQAALPACAAALVAWHCSRAAKCRLPRRVDMESTGKRHDFLVNFEAGFDEQGLLCAVDMQLAAKCGYSADLSSGIVDRAMFHADNAYYLNNARVLGLPCFTHTVSNTAFRGFGGPQGMIAIEALMDDIARELNLDPLDVRKRNLYCQERDETHYGQRITQHLLPEMMQRLEVQCEYRARRDAIRLFNQQQPYIKKGLALTPVKFGISFTAKHLNQAAALLHVYTDGSVMLNHGGTEMGQGLYTKVAQVVATELGIGIDKVQVTAAATDKVPNTAPTAASAGTDLNGMAALLAARKIRKRLTKLAAEHFSVDIKDVKFFDGSVVAGKQMMPFAELCGLAFLQRVPLSARGFYRTPEIHYDREKASGRPYFYFANGVACSEVQVDCLTGEYRVQRVDIIHDVGRSINPALDIGQIEGGFVQGMGWLTTEDLCWDASGRVSSNSPANYKIPTVVDVPPIFNVALYESQNAEATVFRSKAVGEPPLMLAISVWCALRDACASVADYRISPPLAVPATPEQVLAALDYCFQARK